MTSGQSYEIETQGEKYKSITRAKDVEGKPETPEIDAKTEDIHSQVAFKKAVDTAINWLDKGIIKKEEFYKTVHVIWGEYKEIISGEIPF